MACHVTLRLVVIHAMGNDTTLPSRGLGLRLVGKSLGLKSGKAQRDQMFSGFAPKRTSLCAMSSMKSRALHRRRKNWDGGQALGAAGCDATNE